jgi:hypothetical protein
MTIASPATSHFQLRFVEKNALNRSPIVMCPPPGHGEANPSDADRQIGEEDDLFD